MKVYESVDATEDLLDYLEEHHIPTYDKPQQMGKTKRRTSILLPILIVSFVGLGCFFLIQMYSFLFEYSKLTEYTFQFSLLTYKTSFTKKSSRDPPTF